MYGTSSIENGGFDFAQIFFKDVRNCRDKVFTKENFRKIHQKRRKSVCQKYNSGATCPEKNILNNKKFSFFVAD